MKLTKKALDAAKPQEGRDVLLWCGEQAVMSNSIEMHFGNASDLIELVQSRELKALAVSTPKPLAQLPTVPTVAQTVPGFEYVAWNGYAVTGGVPAEVINRLTGALKTVAQDPTVIEIFANLGIDSVGSTPSGTSRTANCTQCPRMQ